MSYDCDVAIIGGGPSGSVAAAALARAGRKVVVFERDTLPRFHIGESLLASVNDVIANIGAKDLVEAAGFPRKWGATFFTATGGGARFADFAASPEVPRPQTWQVPREKFDHLLLRHAAASGADVRERHRVLDVAFDPEGVTLQYRPVLAGESADGAAGEHAAPAHQLRARMLIDASGRTSIVSRRFNLRIDEPRLKNVAIFSHYAGVPRAEGRRSGDIRIVARPDLGWFWMIPISDELMSIGVVLPHEAYRALPKTSDQQLLEQLIADTPAVARLLAKSERRWPVRVERDFSYGSSRYAGDRWVLVGDAGSFLDPMFSSGVAIAMESGWEAAQAIDRGLSSGNLTAGNFDTFNHRQIARFRAFRRFVLSFYTNGFRDLFFSPDPPKWLFSAVITVLAGYWRPSWKMRFWLAVFFTFVWIQQRVPLATKYTDQPTEPDIR